jgi:hypothetical protein
LSTKIHALVDALGNPLRFLLTPGQVHDLVGADALLPQIAADVLILRLDFADRRLWQFAVVAAALAPCGRPPLPVPRLAVIRLNPAENDFQSVSDG